VIAVALACDGELAPHDDAPRAVLHPSSVPGPGVERRARARHASADAEAPASLAQPPVGLVDVVAFVPYVRLAIGYATADNFTGAPLPGYGAAGAWLHPAATDGLASAALELADDDLALVVFDAYRPRRASEAMVAWARANGRDDLLRDGWVAARSQHNRGLAIDVGLADLTTGELLDMGTSWDAFTAESAALALRGAAGDRRRRLRETMQRRGFTPYDREWWHFTWKAKAPVLDVPYGADER